MITYRLRKMAITVVIFWIPLVFVHQSLYKALILWCCICLALALIQKYEARLLTGSAYLTFFSTSILSAVGFMNVLTGLDSGVINTTGVLWGFSFFSLSLSFYLFTEKKFNIVNFFWIIQPIRFFTGPVANDLRLGNLNISKRRLLTNCTWIIVGVFYLYVIAPGLKIFQNIKPSTNYLDVLLFSITFEMYVYFNFAGASFLVMGILKCMGVRCVNNFNAPFSGRNVIEYWQRWHKSLSYLCKILFYLPVRNFFGIYFAVFATFMSSAMWHGITVNFFIWGIFHSLMWLLTYHLLKLKNKIWTLMVFFPTITFGRLLFSESNTNLLIKKIYSLFTLNTSSGYEISQLEFGRVEIFLLLLSVGVVLGEIISPKRFNNYKIFRKGWGVIILLILILLFAIDDAVIVYGAR